MKNDVRVNINSNLLAKGLFVNFLFIFNPILQSSE